MHKVVIDHLLDEPPNDRVDMPALACALAGFVAGADARRDDLLAADGGALAAG